MEYRNVEYKVELDEETGLWQFEVDTPIGILKSTDNDLSEEIFGPGTPEELEAVNNAEDMKMIAEALIDGYLDGDEETEDPTSVTGGM